MASTYTKKARTKFIICLLVDFLILVGPIAGYIIYAIVNDSVTNSGKIIVLASTAIAIILLIFNVLAQKHLRSPIWVVFLGLYCAVDKLIPLIITIGICSILDEFLLTPLIRKYRIMLNANKAIDARSGE